MSANNYTPANNPVELHPTYRCDLGEVRMKPYRLLLVSHEHATRPEQIWDSLTMHTCGLWSEFSKLPHVSLEFHDCRSVPTEGEWDFLLLHAGFSQPIYDMLAVIRPRIRHKIMLFMEFPHPSPLIDYTFSWLPVSQPNAEYMPCPIRKEWLRRTLCIPRNVGSILLDHTYWTHQDKPWAAWLRLYEWLEPFASKRFIGQLGSRYATEENTPHWIRPFREMPYLAYLGATATFETFIPTYSGSYGCSIVDMAARGIRVLVPTWREGPFCHQSLIDTFRLKTFSDRETLFSLLAEPVQPGDHLDRCTDYSECVRRIDTYCQRVME
jgi:hypothetical protein